MSRIPKPAEISSQNILEQARRNYYAIPDTLPPPTQHTSQPDRPQLSHTPSPQRSRSHSPEAHHVHNHQHQHNHQHIPERTHQAQITPSTTNPPTPIGQSYVSTSHIPPSQERTPEFPSYQTKHQDQASYHSHRITEPLYYPYQSQTFPEDSHIDSQDIPDDPFTLIEAPHVDNLFNGGLGCPLWDCSRFPVKLLSGVILGLSM
eukprot:GHVP01029120.1.p1 GENE.GHVP01029120.1~~GHVP01029120.1.p1  ORF type:complete len:204 (+),score=21.53 GHVP01029120.1:375-986(+)